MPVRGSHYNKVYSGSLKNGEGLDSIYERFDLYHPDDLYSSFKIKNRIFKI